MIKWHSVNEYPTVSQVVVIDNNGKIKIAGVGQGKKAPYDWISMEELFHELNAMQYVIKRFSEWETDGCPEPCAFAKDVLKVMMANRIDKDTIAQLLKFPNQKFNGLKCNGYCGMEGRECECWAEHYRKEFENRKKVDRKQ